VNTYEVALGALLHDIGKFMQRAFPPGQGLSAQSKGMESLVCPVSPAGYATHRHALYTNEFVEYHLKWLPPGMDRATVANLAAYHHRPGTREQEWIAKADRLSSGIDRRDDEEAESGARRHRTTRLCSVAAGVGQRDGGREYTFALEPLDADAVFPMTRAPEEDLTREYRRLWDAFVDEWVRNRCGNPFQYVARALGVLERYTWCVPSATNALPDVSLYDHAKSTAAIAVALAGAPADEEKPFLLAAGDLTGIQKYIFGFKMGVGGLARRLRARSFNVNAFTQAMLLRVLRRLDLPLTQVILMAGGKFHLLLPNTPEARACLEETGAEASRWLREISGGETAAVIASLARDEKELADFSTALTALHERLREERARAGRTLLIRDGRWDEEAFVLPPLDVRDGLCECCGRQGGRLREDPDGDAAVICDRCDDDERTGARLPRCRYIAFHDDDQHGEYATPAGRYSLLSEQDLSGKAAREALLVLDLDGAPDVERVPEAVPVVGQVWARYAPRDAEGRLEDLKTLAGRSKGVAYLGCLKMDVDDLGWIFGTGTRLGGDAGRASMARVATLSRTLDLFFKAHLERLLEEKFPDVYLVYAGGDDVLALGPWDQVFELARQIRADFRKMSGGNPIWKLSAGIALTQPGVPVVVAADHAEELLEASKQAVGTVPAGGTAKPADLAMDAVPYPFIGKRENGAAREAPAVAPSKDRLTAFGTAMRWEAFEVALREATRLLSWIEDGTVNTARARRLLRAANGYRAFQRTRDTRHLAYAPMLVYDLRRNWKEETEAQREAKLWAARLASAPDAPGLPRLRFVAEYALYGARKTERSTEEEA